MLAEKVARKSAPDEDSAEPTDHPPTKDHARPHEVSQGRGHDKHQKEPQLLRWDEVLSRGMQKGRASP
jgi:hypothetical protein